MAKLSYASYLLLLLLIVFPGKTIPAQRFLVGCLRCTAIKWYIYAVYVTKTIQQDNKGIWYAGIKGQGENNGTNLTALQKHVSFFDRDKDGVIYLEETYQGFRALGFGVAFSSAASVLINGFLSSKTNNGSISAFFLPVLVANIQKGIHGSDTGAYDTEGRFVSEKFEEIFQKHAHTNTNALTSDELNEMLQANQHPDDFQGRVASRSEWEALLSLAKDKNGLLQKDTIRSVYDGSLFYKLEGEKNSIK